MKQRWIAPVVVAVSVVLGAVVYFARPIVIHGNSSSAQEADSPALYADQQTSAPTGAGTCFGLVSSRAPRETLREKYRWAQTLLDQRLFEAALPELREVATLDPGFPGINLDLSNALLQAKHDDGAREAADAQIGISECLSKQSPEALDAYCRSEFSGQAVESCRPELDRIHRSALLQLTLVHLEVGQADEPSATVRVATPEVAALPRPNAARAAPVARRAISGPHPAQRKESGDRTLMDGAGTDSALGAYSKQ